MMGGKGKEKRKKKKKTAGLRFRKIVTRNLE
jgi:hypothetical protein